MEAHRWLQISKVADAVAAASDACPSIPFFGADEPRVGDLTRSDFALDPALDDRRRDQPMMPPVSLLLRP